MKNLNLSKHQALIGLIIFSIIVAILNPNFITPDNIRNVLRQTSINAIIASGMTLVIITAGIDLSVGSTFAFASVVVAKLCGMGLNPTIAILAGLAVGAVIGMMNGTIIAKAKLQPFIVTLSTMTIVSGLTLIITEGKPVSVDLGGLAWIGAGSLFTIPVPVVIMVAVILICYFILTQTTIGRYIYAVGSNEEAAKLSGVNVDRVKIFVYTVAGALAALAGIIIMARLSSAQPNAGEGYELDAIAAVVLGGTSQAGGIGNVTGTIVGALIIGVLNNSLNLMNVSSYYQLLAKGVVILIAVLIDKRSKK